MTSTERDDAHAGSPSDAATVSVVRPTLLQVQVGPVVAASLNVPDVAVHRKLSGAGALSRSLAVAASEIEWPKMTSAGDASTPSIRGHTLSVPLMRMLPVVGCSLLYSIRGIALV